MAKVSLSGLGFTGPLGNVSAYTMRGVPGIIMRTKGGASKDKIKKSPKFKRTRELNAEFGGRAAASKWIMQALWPQKALADYNIAGPVNALLNPIQALDTDSKKGQRNIFFTKSPYLFGGFSLNRTNTFDSTIRNPLSYTISRDTVSASITIPDLVPGINFFAPDKYPMFSLQATLGVLPDLSYSKFGYIPSVGNYHAEICKIAVTNWFPVQKGSSATTLQLKFDVPPSFSSYSLILSIGVRYGLLLDTNTVQQAKYAGCAKILAMG